MSDTESTERWRGEWERKRKKEKCFCCGVKGNSTLVAGVYSVKGMGVGTLDDWNSH